MLKSVSFEWSRPWVSSFRKNFTTWAGHRRQTTKVGATNKHANNDIYFSSMLYLHFLTTKRNSRPSQHTNESKRPRVTSCNIWYAKTKLPHFKIFMSTSLPERRTGLPFACNTIVLLFCKAGMHQGHGSLSEDTQHGEQRDWPNKALLLHARAHHR